jgi:hypothetical protein
MEAAEFLALLDTVDAAQVEAADSCAHWTPGEVLAVHDRLEAHRRRQPMLDHVLIGRIQDSRIELGCDVTDVLIHRLRLSKKEANRRITAARVLGPRQALTGEALAPEWAASAAAQADGLIGAEHLEVIGEVLGKLPRWVDAVTFAQAEATLARLAAQFGPEELREAGRVLVDCLDPDGPEPDDGPNPQRHLTIGPQRRDGLSKLTGLIGPELRAALQALFAKTAAPGHNNPDQPPTEGEDGSGAGGEPDRDTTDAGTAGDTDPDAAEDEAARRDHRSLGQRQHDALTALCHQLLGAPTLGTHHGLPVTIVVTTTLNDLQSGTGSALTATGTQLPMREVIRLAARAHHYLAVFDDHTGLPLYLGRSRRIASPAQRLLLYAMDKGCTRPGCTTEPARCQADHLIPWADGGTTDITNLGLACGHDNRAKTHGWTTHRTRGRVQWTPPAHLDSGQPRTNHHHHPHEYLAEPDSDDGERPNGAA